MNAFKDTPTHLRKKKISSTTTERTKNFKSLAENNREYHKTKNKNDGMKNESRTKDGKKV